MARMWVAAGAGRGQMRRNNYLSKGISTEIFQL